MSTGSTSLMNTAIHSRSNGLSKFIVVFVSPDAKACPILNLKFGKLSKLDNLHKKYFTTMIKGGSNNYILETLNDSNRWSVWLLTISHDNKNVLVSGFVTGSTQYYGLYFTEITNSGSLIDISPMSKGLKISSNSVADLQLNLTSLDIFSIVDVPFKIRKL